MTPAQTEALTALANLAVVIGGLIGLPLAILQIIDTTLEISSKLSKRRKKRTRRGQLRRPGRAQPTGQGPVRRGRAPPK